MAEAVASAMESGKHLLVQAGTGTGKSLAYLVPALLHSEDRPIVVSTATLALQSQLIDVDLPRLVDAVEPLLGRRPTYAVLKGRHHYACLAKLEVADEPADDLFSDPDSPAGGTVWLGEASRIGRQVQRIRDWVLESETGDREELDPGVDDRVWRTVSMSARECVGASRCPYGEDCFAELARARAREADIVVTNHTLLALDMLQERRILPPHHVLIVDEAHELADRVTSAAQAELSASTVDRAARRARALLDPAVHERLTEAGDALALALAEAPVGRLPQLPARLAEALTLVESACRAALDGIGEIRADDADAVRKQQTKGSLEQVTEVAQRLLACSEHDVVWTEPDRQGGRAPSVGASSIVVAPLSVAGLLGFHLYDDRTVIATSATLTLGGTFDTVARAMGLSAEDGPEWTELDVGSPFDYAKQGILYVAAHLPRPTESGLSDAAAEELVRLVTASDGGALGLFSSRRAAERAAEVVRARTDLSVLLQGEESLPALVRRFREADRTCLFGVLSLWQGVDIPGDACRLVVIDRLPFPRPDEPIAAARAAAIDAAGGSGFAAVSVPIAAVRLAQGAGRLIRRSTDRGVVAVLDSRLHRSRSYGAFLRRSLPPFWYTTKSDVVQGALRRLAEARMTNS